MGSFRALTSSSCCAACDMKNKQSSTANAAANSNSNKLCNAFAYSDGICFLKSCAPKLLQNIIKEKRGVIDTGSVIPMKTLPMMSAYKLSY